MAVHRTRAYGYIRGVWRFPSKLRFGFGGSGCEVCSVRAVSSLGLVGLRSCFDEGSSDYTLHMLSRRGPHNNTLQPCIQGHARKRQAQSR